MLLAEIARLNADPEVDGILVQLPLPPQIRTQAVLEAVDPAKDVDGFHPLNIGRLRPATRRWCPARRSASCDCLRRPGSRLPARGHW